MSLLSYIQFLNESVKYNNLSNVNIVLEGGAYGHLNHPFEDMELSFKDMKDMINATIHGLFTPDNFVHEKTDGQNLMFSWKNGKLIGARNKSNLKNYGEKSLDIEGIIAMFKGRGDIEYAFRNAMSDLSNAISKLKTDDIFKLFGEGKRFASIEIITPKTQNTIPYGMDMLVFHGITTFDENGSPIDEDKSGGFLIANLLKEINADIQESFYIRGPQKIEIMPIADAVNVEKRYMERLNEIIKSGNVNWNSTIKDYLLAIGIKTLDKLAKDQGKNIPSTLLEPLSKRIFLEDKGYNQKSIERGLGDDFDWYMELEKTQGAQLKKNAIKPIEFLFLELGALFMKNVTTMLAANPTNAAIEMKNEINKAIIDIQNSNDIAKINKLNWELERIAAIGGLDAIVPSEGITFVWNGKQYKYTGIFAALNKIRGMLVYGK